MSPKMLKLYIFLEWNRTDWHGYVAIVSSCSVCFVTFELKNVLAFSYILMFRFISLWVRICLCAQDQCNILWPSSECNYFVWFFSSFLLSNSGDCNPIETKIIFRFFISKWVFSLMVDGEFRILNALWIYEMNRMSCIL